MRYFEYQPLIDQARPKAQLWRLILGLGLIVAIYVMLGRGAMTVLGMALGDAGGDLYRHLPAGGSPLAMYVLLFGFGLLGVSVVCATMIVHGRGFAGLIGPPRRFLRQFGRVCAGLVVLYGAVLVLPPWDLGAPLGANLPVALWLGLLPLSLVAVLVQVSAEELLFRGYLQQQLAARFNGAWVFVLVPSVLFGLGHFMPDQAGDNAGLIALWAMVFGVLLADITARAGTLGPAIALHFVNNVTAILIISVPDSLSGLALFTGPFDMNDTQAFRAWLPVDFALMWLSWLVARIAIRR